MSQVSPTTHDARLTTKKIIIAIDGPAGSGKSTVATLVAARFCLPYIDTGAMYRALTFLCLKKGIPWTSPKRVGAAAKKADIDLRAGRNGAFGVSINGVDVTREIRTPALTKQVHRVASLPAVRRAMVGLQRRLGGKRGGVLEGRDIGTVVFPGAPFKFYLDADFVTRARRRYRELRKKGIVISFREVQRDLNARDHKDFTRKIGPLKPASDARRIDTTALTIREVVAIICRIVSSRVRRPGRLKKS